MVIASLGHTAAQAEQPVQFACNITAPPPMFLNMFLPKEKILPLNLFYIVTVHLPNEQLFVVPHNVAVLSDVVFVEQADFLCAI